MERWLDTFNAGQYVDAYGALCEAGKRQVPQQEWVVSAQNTHATLGVVKNRVLTRVEWIAQVQQSPNKPKGEFVSFYFSGRLVTGVEVVEMVSTMKATNGAWNVCGHFVSPAN